jgi:hypothetical protein
MNNYQLSHTVIVPISYGKLGLWLVCLRGKTVLPEEVKVEEWEYPRGVIRSIQDIIESAIF